MIRSQHENPPESQIDVDVLIIGSGPAGTALAVELGLQGLTCHVFERRTARQPQPKAKLTNIRTMGLMRRWGIADRVRDRAPLPPGFPSDVAFLTTLTGYELTRFPNAFSTAPDRTRPYPEPAQQMPQDMLEEVLRERADELPGVQITRGVMFKRFEEYAEGIEAQLEVLDTGAPITVRAKYLAGADGARSRIRGQLGIEMPGQDLAANVSAVLRAPGLWELNDKPPAVQYWITTKNAPGIIGPLDTEGLWWFHLSEADNGGVLTNAEVEAKFQAAVGAEFQCETVSQGPWQAERRLADTYRAGRTFLLGDAAHLHPPMGGYGMNMGVGDGLDLGWKLAAVLKGWGDDALLDSYETERRPIHQRVIDEATVNYQRNSNQYKSDELELEGPAGDALRIEVGAAIHEQKAQEFASTGVQLGYRYEGSPVIVSDGTPEPPNEISSYTPTARPGHLAPHAWLNAEECVYDRLGFGLNLISFSAEPELAEPFVRAAAVAEIPLTLIELPGSEIRDLYGADLVLVRPDQTVAWRGDQADDAGAILDRIRGRAADREQVAR